jgi:aryl sulfotransferase
LAYQRDERTASRRSLVLEAFEARAQIIAYLSANGFPDLGEEDLIALYSVRHNLAPQVIADLSAGLGVTGLTIAQSSSRMISSGYLELRAEPGQRGRPRLTTTRRGLDVSNAIQHVLNIKRWADFPLRPDDIVISTVPKCGTTWMQMICAQLIFQSPDLPGALQDLSPWLEWPGHARDAVFAMLDGQKHRRFIKTHMSLADIPVDSRATYIVVGRHPLDSALSYFNARAASTPDGEGISVKPELPVDVILRQWVNREAAEPGKNVTNLIHFTLPGVMQHLSDSWARRNEPNVLLFHYQRLSEDLEDEMRRLAAALAIAVPESGWAGLVKAATFAEMRASAGRLQPRTDLKDPSAFFRAGRSGRGREILTGPELADYHERVARLAPPELVAWLHGQRDPA